MGERDEILKLKERITQLEEENKTLMLNYQLQMKQVDEEFTRKILSIETLLSEEQQLKREHQLKIEQMERESREAINNHQKELERLNVEFEQRMQAMKAELMAEKELALKQHSEKGTFIAFFGNRLHLITHDTFRGGKTRGCQA